jgi:hypothetical protein
MPASSPTRAAFAVFASLALPLPAAAATTTRDVIIANPSTTPALTRDVDNGALQPVQFSLVPSSLTSGQAAAYYQVPAGKRLVIEYYSAQAQDLTGGAVGLTLATSVSGVFTSYIVFVNANTTNQVNQTTRIYADPGTTVQAFVFNAGGAKECGSVISVSGYLVNVAPS